MKKQLFEALVTAIPFVFVSIHNEKEVSVYSFKLPYKDDYQYVELASSYSHASPDNLYACYELYINGLLIEKAYQPVLDKAQSRPFKDNKPCDQLEILLTACSLRVIEQEQNSHQYHMLKTFVNSRNSHSS